MSAKLSSGFKSSNHQYDGGGICFFRSGIMALATNGAGDLNNGQDMAPFDCWLKEMIVKTISTSTKPKANAKMSIGTATDDDKFLDSLALATGVLGNFFATAGRTHRIPVSTSNGFLKRFVRAGEIIEFDFDALAIAATGRLSVVLVADSNDSGN